MEATTGGLVNDELKQICKVHIVESTSGTCKAHMYVTSNVSLSQYILTEIDNLQDSAQLVNLEV